MDERRATAEFDADGVAHEFDELRAVIDAQAAMIESLKERLEHVERGTSAPGIDDKPTIGSSVLPDVDALTSRRNLMTKGAAVAAGAAMAGTVASVVTASPAAAASGTFDGNPAVDATANPTSGDAIHAQSANGKAIVARTSNPASLPVIGQNDATTALRGY